jgi:hypothetical protein
MATAKLSKFHINMRVKAACQINIGKITIPKNTVGHITAHAADGKFVVQWDAKPTSTVHESQIVPAGFYQGQRIITKEITPCSGLADSIPAGTLGTVFMAYGGDGSMEVRFDGIKEKHFPVRWVNSKHLKPITKEEEQILQSQALQRLGGKDQALAQKIDETISKMPFNAGDEVIANVTCHAGHIQQGDAGVVEGLTNALLVSVNFGKENPVLMRREWLTPLTVKKPTLDLLVPEDVYPPSDKPRYFRPSEKVVVIKTDSGVAVGVEGTVTLDYGFDEHGVEYEEEDPDHDPTQLVEVQFDFDEGGPVAKMDRDCLRSINGPPPKKSSYKSHPLGQHKCKDGTTIDISAMKDDHLCNAVKLIVAHKGEDWLQTVRAGTYLKEIKKRDLIWNDGKAAPDPKLFLGVDHTKSQTFVGWNFVVEPSPKKDTPLWRVELGDGVNRYFNFQADAIEWLQVNRPGATITYDNGYKNEPKSPKTKPKSSDYVKKFTAEIELLASMGVKNPTKDMLEKLHKMAKAKLPTTSQEPQKPKDTSRATRQIRI